MKHKIKKLGKDLGDSVRRIRRSFKKKPPQKKIAPQTEEKGANTQTAPQKAEKIITTKKHEKDDFKTLTLDNVKYKTRLPDMFLHRKVWAGKPKPGEIVAPLTGTMGKTKKVDDIVKKGDYVTIESMKMENQIIISESGIVKKVFFKEGDHVKKGDILLLIEPA